MECRKCPLNIDSACFRPSLFKKLPMHVREIFICNRSANHSLAFNAYSAANGICARDLWVLTFIGENDCFACDKAAETLDHLVSGGHAELLCSLFETASYNVRRDLWLRMTSLHADRLYLFDALFEKESLAPLEQGQIPDNLHHYQHHMLFSSGSSHQLARDL